MFVPFAAYEENSLVVGLARVGSPEQKIVGAPMAVMAETDLGPPLHCMVIPGVIQPLEKDFLAQFCAPGIL